MCIYKKLLRKSLEELKKRRKTTREVGTKTLLLQTLRKIYDFNSALEIRV